MRVVHEWTEHLVMVPKWLQTICLALGFTVQTNSYREVEGDD